MPPVPQNGFPRRARPTIRDVARTADVGISTVSSFLNSTRPVSSATRTRITRAIEDLGYEPNSMARNLRRRRAGAIGLVLPDVMNPFFMLVASGIEEVIRADDFCFVLCPANFEAEREAGYLRLLRRQQLDGVIILSGSALSSPALLELATREPVVLVDELIAGVDAPFVAADNRRGARSLAEYVVGLGHRRVAVVAGPPGLWTAEQRLSGYREALAANGLDPDPPVVHGDYRLDSGYAAARTLLAGCAEERPTALIASNDLMAIGCARFCADNHLQVGRDVSIAGFDDIPLAELVTPGLTTVRQPAREIGRHAARFMLARVQGGRGSEASAEHRELETTLVIRESMAAPGGGR
jgi:DNA-binding LacI/PurR family transcriptional regulator